MLNSLRKVVFRLSPNEALFARREFESADTTIQAKLEEVLRVFIAGYNLALEFSNYETLAQKFEENFDSHHVGFAFEGAGMCLAMFDLVLPREASRLRRFTDGAACRHDYIATVGAGFAVARLPYGPRVVGAYMGKLAPMVAWCVFDGYGFHQGIFHTRSFVKQCKEPPSVWPAYARALFDAGLGRSLWWIETASALRIQTSIDRFPVTRQAEMWHGVGVAAAYAGGVSDETLIELLERSGRYRGDLLSGIPFAARMRQKAGNASLSTDSACRLLLHMTTDQAANLVVQYLDGIAGRWKGTQEELGANGYMLVRQRLTQGFVLDPKQPVSVIQ